MQGYILKSPVWLKAYFHETQRQIQDPETVRSACSKIIHCRLLPGCFLDFFILLCEICRSISEFRCSLFFRPAKCYCDNELPLHIFTLQLSYPFLEWMNRKIILCFAKAFCGTNLKLTKARSDAWQSDQHARIIIFRRSGALKPGSPVSSRRPPIFGQIFPVDIYVEIVFVCYFFTLINCNPADTCCGFNLLLFENFIQYQLVDGVDLPGIFIPEMESASVAGQLDKAQWNHEI